MNYKHCLIFCWYIDPRKGPTRRGEHGSCSSSSFLQSLGGINQSTLHGQYNRNKNYLGSLQVLTAQTCMSCLNIIENEISTQEMKYNWFFIATYIYLEDLPPHDRSFGQERSSLLRNCFDFLCKVYVQSSTMPINNNWPKSFDNLRHLNRKLFYDFIRFWVCTGPYFSQFSDTKKPSKKSVLGN